MEELTSGNTFTFTRITVLKKEYIQHANAAKKIVYKLNETVHIIKQTLKKLAVLQLRNNTNE